MKENNFAIIGLGFISPRHIRSIKQTGGIILLTCDTDLSKCADYTDWRQMMEDPRWQEITHVAICTPNYLHYEMCEAMKDKVVICEKPMCLDSSKLPEKAFGVLQLRHHPEVIKAKGELKDVKNVELVVKVKRDPSYWSGWKGDDSKSGGILFNLGIHYFDLLIHLFGENYQIAWTLYDPKKAEGVILFGNVTCHYHIEIMPTDEGQERKLVIDGKELMLSKHDNLSFEDLHVKVYEDVLEGNGITASEAVKSIKLVEKLKC